MATLGKTWRGGRRHCRAPDRHRMADSDGPALHLHHRRASCAVARAAHCLRPHRRPRRRPAARSSPHCSSNCAMASPPICAARGWTLPASDTPIQPVVIGANDAALAAAAQIEAAGLRVPAIRPPTVPAGTARLRITLCADHGGGCGHAAQRASGRPRRLDAGCSSPRWAARHRNCRCASPQALPRLTGVTQA